MKNKISLVIATIISICTLNLHANYQDMQGTFLTLPKLSWAQISEQSRNAVVQIFSYTKEPHHFIRYKNPDDGGGAGTGFLINKDGEILTNFHVVDKAAKIFVQHPKLSKEKLEVDFIGGCPEQDIALLKLKKEDCDKIKNLLSIQELPFLEMGNSDTLVEAQKIMTLGYPEGKETIKSSCGDVSGRESTHIGECIQTTTPVNPGNSGGPFLNKLGQVIGLCVLKQVGTEIEGIAFLIPINNAKKLLPHLRKSKIVRRPYWGITYQPINDDLINFLEIPVTSGVLVTKIYKNSLFEQAGLEKNDIIYTVNNETIDRYGYIQNRISLMDFLNMLELESTVSFDIFRNNQQLKIEYSIKQADSFKIKEYYYGYENLPDYEVIGGLVITELSLNQIELGKELQASLFRYRGGESNIDISNITKYEKPENRFDSKVLISYIIPGSEISNSRCLNEIIPGYGIPSDPIIEEINGIKVSNMEQVRAAILQTKDYLKIETKGGGLVILSLEQLAIEDTVLSKHEKFEPSKLVNQLLQNAMTTQN